MEASTLLFLLQAGCAEPGQVAIEAEELEVEIVRVEPSEATITTGPTGGETIQFQAYVTYQGRDTGSAEEVEWSVSNPSAGSIDQTGLFTPATTNGGITWVKARFAGVDDTATVTVVYSEDIVDGEVDPGLFDAWQGNTALVDSFWLYPEDGVNIPRNTPSIRFEWSEMGADAYQLRFRSELTDFGVFTSNTSYTADEASWQRLASTNAGGTLQIELSAAVAGGVQVSPPLQVQVNRMDASGSIYYWSTSASGIKEIPYGEQAVDFLTEATVGHCTACHAISSTGNIAFTYDGGNGSMGVKSIDDGSDIIPYGQAYGNFMSFSPDGRYLLSAYAGSFLLFDGETGEYLNEVGTGYLNTQPSWSPDGTEVAFVAPTAHSYDWVFSGGRLMTMRHYGDGTFGEVELLYGDATRNAYYPAWSPDGDWIAFNMSTGDSYDDEDAQVYVIRASGGPPISLDRLNQGEYLYNSWPKWGPLPDDDILWLAVASRRAYGTVVSGTPQIWVAAFDPAVAARGMDPSWPAFWLPGQDTTQNNHIPVWAE